LIYRLNLFKFEKIEYLEPTLANLFGLDMRFREVEEKHAQRVKSKQL